jgi:RNA polymerase sigma factor (sigma-70 family)
MPRRRDRPPLDPAMQKFCEEETVRLLPLVERIARRARLPLPIEDLVQEGAIAVFEALPRYDASRGCTVETWITPRVFGAMRDYARKMGRLLHGGARTGRLERLVSIDQTVQQRSGDRPIAVKDLIQAPPVRRRGYSADGWSNVAAGLSKRERLLLTEYFIVGRTMRQIGRSLRLSESCVSQMMSGLLARLRSADAADGRVRELVA